MRPTPSSIAALVLLLLTTYCPAAAQTLASTLSADLKQNGPTKYLVTYLLAGTNPSSGALIWAGTDAFQLGRVDGQSISYIIPISAVANVQKTGEAAPIETKPVNPDAVNLKNTLNSNYKGKMISVFYLLGAGNHGSMGMIFDLGDNYVNLRTTDNKNFLIPFSAIAFIEVPQ
jgi:hypothetical protein